MLDTPVAFIIFNRPDFTHKVFVAIAQAKPKKLLVVADGPRSPEEAEKCHQTRSVIEKIDWECEVLTNFSDTNMGCKLRVSSGLDWVFSQVEEAIILEDDCVPDLSFFPYCTALLETYRNCQEVMVITGCNFQPGNARTADSYFFSRYLHIWGWASWRRAWKQYDVEMKAWSEIDKEAWLKNIVQDKASVRYWTNIFNQVALGEIDTWDYQWLFSCWKAGGLSVQPSKNLISNIGFGAGATHTTLPSPLADLPTQPMKFPLRHPHNIKPNRAADHYTAKMVYASTTSDANMSIIGRLKRFIRNRIALAH